MCYLERENVLYVTTFKYTSSLMPSISTTTAEFRSHLPFELLLRPLERASVLPVFLFLPPKSTPSCYMGGRSVTHVSFHVNGFRMLKC